jgi:hypothetical protein
MELTAFHHAKPNLTHQEVIMIQSIPSTSRQNNVTWNQLLANPQRFTVRTYENRLDLKDQLREVENQPGQKSQTVILLLSEEFDGNLPALIRRRTAGERLIVTSDMGYLPGLVGGRDIAFRAGMLGWNRISFVHDLDDVVQALTDSDSPVGQAVVLVPEESR